MSTTSFEISPKMSTYLLAFIVSDFDYISNVESIAEGETLHRIYARGDIVQGAQVALMNSAAFLKALEQYADYVYELPKMYSAAVPDFGAGKTFYKYFIMKTNQKLFRRNGKLGFDHL